MPELQDCKVNLENYYGPIDLLLHLVKETEVDITRIALARACEQYIAFLSAMEKLDINLSGDFLTLASQLLLIKSRTLAPPVAVEGEEAPPEEEEDASLELIKKLLEYKRIKDRARALDQMAAERARRSGRPKIRLEGETEHEPLRNLELWDLVLLYSRVLKQTRLDVAMSILYRDVPLEIFVEKILQALVERRTATLSELLAEGVDRSRLIGTFLAILELAKEQRLHMRQDQDWGDIRVEAKAPPAGPEATSTPAP